jgi:release factor glutamine methyltransferase
MPAEINACIADARRRLRAVGIPLDEAILDARLLAQHVLGWDAARLLTHGDQPAPEGFGQAFDEAVARRATREPLAYITGRREFWNLDIEVTPAVLIPRPETELLIEAALEHCDADQPVRILDVCTGSGCVAIAVGREFRLSRVVASDISEAALDVARRNAARHGLASRLQCVTADLFTGLTGPFELILANPPYVPAVAAPGLQPEVREFEPAAALFAGHDGLRVIRRLVKEAVPVMDRSGLLIFEFGAGQDQEVCALVSSTPALRLVEIKHDLQDIPRAAVVQRTS